MTALLDSIQGNFSALPAAMIDAQGLGDARRAAMLQTMAEGLPSQRHERWKYTALRALSTRSFVATAESPQLHAATLADIPEPRLVFVNGRLEIGLSAISALPDGLSVNTLSAALVTEDARAAAVLSRRFEQSDEAFARLNAALATEGALVRVAAEARIEAPLHLVFVGMPASADIASHLRHAIELGENARLTIVEHHIAGGANRHLGNQLLQLNLRDKAMLIHARVQDEDAGATLIARTDATLASGAHYHRVDLELGAGLSRHELNVALAGDGAQFQSSGALLAGGRRHVDTRLGIEHIARDTRCDLLWRGLAADRGRLAFHGGITIHAGADGSDARLSNKNLLLSDNAEIDTQPVLQIHADEVKAAHGATIGRLDPTALFYLRSRGIPAQKARALLTLAFCREALASIGDLALVELLSPRLEARLAELESAT
jgi:Fe-S cluster assembly protein SufD